MNTKALSLLALAGALCLASCGTDLGSLNNSPYKVYKGQVYDSTRDDSSPTVDAVRAASSGAAAVSSVEGAAGGGRFGIPGLW